MVLPAETRHLTTHLRARLKEGVRMNLNFLGEALLGEEEAARRLAKYLDMEEYGDLGLTAEPFMRTLDRPGLEQVKAGIALQA